MEPKGRKVAGSKSKNMMPRVSLTFGTPSFASKSKILPPEEIGTLKFLFKSRFEVIWCWQNSCGPDVDRVLDVSIIECEEKGSGYCHAPFAGDCLF